MFVSLAGVVSQLVLLIAQHHWSALAAVALTHLPTVIAPVIVWSTYGRDANGSLWARFGEMEEQKLLVLWFKIITVSTVGAMLGVIVAVGHLRVAQSGVEFWVATVVGVTLWTLLVDVAAIPRFAEAVPPPA
jgi:hypothetical protein